MEEKQIFQNYNRLYYNSLIDSGGLILNNKFDDIKKLIIANHDNCEYILYIDSKHVRYVYDIKKQETIKYNNQVYEKLFIFYEPIFPPAIIPLTDRVFVIIRKE